MQHSVSDQQSHKKNENKTTTAGTYLQQSTEYS